MKLRWSHVLVGAFLLGALGATPSPGAVQLQAQPGSLLILDIEDRGTVVIQLELDRAPRTTAQIADLARDGFYDDQRFFRVAREPRPFLVQTGDPNSRTRPMNDPTLGENGSGTRIAYEDSGLPNERGAVGLATLPNDRNSGDSQFYILMSSARFLDGQYTVFGTVIEGMDVVDRIELGDRIVRASVR